MIQRNVLLGHGDSARFNLLGGTNGDAGDVVLLNGAYARRANEKKARSKYYQSYALPMGGDPSGGTSGRDPYRPRRRTNPL